CMLFGAVVSQPPIADILIAFFDAIAVGWVLAHSRHLAELCDRIPEPNAASKCRRAGLIVGLLLSAVFLPDCLPRLGRPAGRSGGQPALIMIVQLSYGLVVCGLFGSGLWALALHSIVAKRLRKASKEAKANWPGAFSA